MRSSAPVARRSRSRSVRRSVAALGALAVALVSGAAGAAGDRIPLPSPADIAALPPDPLSLLGGADVGELTTRIPGPIDDAEAVHVGMAADGAPVSVIVYQTLTLHGVGDYAFSIQGPSTNVTGPSDAPVQPGLRRGRIIWQGFSPGERTLQARATLDMRFESERLPLRVSVQAPSGPTTGPARVTIALDDRTSRDVPVTTGEPSRDALEAAFAAIGRALDAGRPPVAGAGDIPASLPGAPGARRELGVRVPFAYTGTLTFGAGTIDGVTVSGAGGNQVAPNAVAFSGRTDRDAGPIEIALSGRGAARPVVHLEARAVLPSATLTRTGSLARDLETVQVTLWQALRLPEFQQHLGAPRVRSARTTFVYDTTQASASHGGGGEKPDPFAIALACVAALAVIGNAAAIWSRS